jgi:hypothetical protein
MCNPNTANSCQTLDNAGAMVVTLIYVPVLPS